MGFFSHDYEICVRVAKNFVDYVVEAPDQAARCAECVKLLKVPSVCKDPALLESLIHEIEAYLSSGRNDVCTVAKKLSKFLASLKALSVPNSIVQTKEKASGGDLRKSKVAKSNKPKSEDGEETEKEDEEEEGCKTDVGTEAEDESEMVIMKQALVERQRSYVPDESESLETCCDESNKEASCGESTTKKKSAVEVGKEDDENLAAPVPKRPKLAKSEKATKKEPMILFAGFTKFPELRAQLEKQVAELGGTVRGEDASVSTRVTHVVRPEGALSTRMLVAALFGAWVVGPKWVTDSSEKGEFLDEAMYGKRFMEETHPLRGRKVVMDESYKDDPKFDGIFDTLLIRDAGKAEIVEFVPGVKCDIALVAKNVSATALKDLAETGARIYTRSQFYKSLLP